MTLSTWRADATSVEGADDYRSPDEAVNPTLPSSPRSDLSWHSAAQSGLDKFGLDTRTRKARRLLVARRVL